MLLKHILRTQEFDRQWLKDFFAKVKATKFLFASSTSRSKLRQCLKGKILYSVFFEPSTRTRFSFETAALNLGMNVVTTENAGEFSSTTKGESLDHTIRVLCGYRPDVIVLRHKETGAAERVALIASEYKVHLINGGDGTGQHPTQALLDVFTIHEHFGSISNKHIVIGGDLAHGRTVKSLAYLLSKFEGIQFTFVSHPLLRMDTGVLNHLKKYSVPFIEITDNSEIDRAFPEADVVYWTRTQRERIDSSVIKKAMASNKYRIGLRQAKLLPAKSIILHPLPIAGEIAREVDAHPAAHYFVQSDNGLFVRMALLKLLLEEGK